MDQAKVILDITDKNVAVITLNRPQVRNAFDDETIALLIDYLTQIAARDDIRALLLKANGKHFSAGADLNWMARMAKNSAAENLADAKQLAKLMSSLDLLSIPTIGVIQGAAYGGAVGLTACCDMVFASEQSSFCLSEVKIGLIPSTISPYVVRAMGERNARRYFVSAEVFDANSAKTLGLVHEVVDEQQLTTISEQWIAKLLNNGPTAMKEAKKLAVMVSSQPISEELITATAHSIADIRATAEAVEGLTAFLEKRKPSWANK